MRVITVLQIKVESILVVFSWPYPSLYIVYMLREMDILKDWAAIRKVNLKLFLSVSFLNMRAVFIFLHKLFSNCNCQSVFLSKK